MTENQIVSFRKPKTSSLVFIIVFLLLVLMAGGAYYYYLQSQEEENTLQGSEYKEEIIAEEAILNDYYKRKNLAYPEEYDVVDTPYKRMLLLRSGVIEMEVSWKSGGIVFIKASGPGEEETARSIISKYREQALNGEAIELVISSANSDPEIIRINGDDVMSYPIRHVTRDRRMFLNVEVQNAFFGSPAGTVSEIYKHDIGEVLFFAITESFDGPFQTYTDWLYSASQGKITEPSSKYN